MLASHEKERTVAKEWVLNSATNRWGLNKKRSVGPTSLEIRRCGPDNVEQWKQYYYANVYPESHLEDLGRRLYAKITEVLDAELQEVTQRDCIDYIKNLVINRTYQGYVTEKQTVYGQLEQAVGAQIKPAPDEWDRLYNVDFYIQVGSSVVGIQIKPTTFEFTFEDHKWKEMQKRTHETFRERFGGRVFIVFSVGEKGQKAIKNTDVIEEIRQEIARLEREQDST